MVFLDREVVDMLQTQEVEQRRKGKLIDEAFEMIFNHMRIAGNRHRTIDSYKYIFKPFVKVNCIEYVEEIYIDSIYNYLGSIDVSKRTKLIRLKSTKAVLGKFHNNGWLKERSWSNIQIKVDKEK